MNTITPISKTTAAIIEHDKQLVVENPWYAASDSARETAMLREQFLAPLVSLVNTGVSDRPAIRNVLQNIASGNYAASYIETAYKLGRGGKLPSRPAISNWLKAYRQAGRNGLLTKQTGRVRKDYGWEHLAIQLYNIPSQPAYSTVALKLREEYGEASATDSAVRRYLKSLPSTLNISSPQRLGKKYHKLNRGKYIERTTESLLVGEIYEGDGHAVDCYIAHPNTGLPWRPELTVWIDIKSKLIVGWYMSEAESAHSTLFALSHAMLTHDHVPAWIHIDNGAGFKAKILNDESVGFYKNFNINTTFAIPGNSKGKGLVEGWFRPFRDRHDKFFNGGQDYCGHDMAEEANRQITIEIKKGKRKLRSLAEYTESVARYIALYNQRSQKSLDGKSPADCWAELKPIAVGIPAQAVMRPSEQRTARRCAVTLHKRRYEHNDLALYDRKTVEVQYDLHDDSKVWIYDDKKRLICIALLKRKTAWMPDSRLEEGRKKREEGRVKRLQRKIDLVEKEERDSIDAAAQLEHIEAITQDDFIIEHDPSSDDIYNDIALLDDLDDE